MNAVCGIVYWINLRLALDRMRLNNDELAKSLFALKSRQLAGIPNDITKMPAAKDQTARKGEEKQQERKHLHIPGYFPLTPTILQVRKPQVNTYLHYGL